MSDLTPRERDAVKAYKSGGRMADIRKQYPHIYETLQKAEIAPDRMGLGSAEKPCKDPHDHGRLLAGYACHVRELRLLERGEEVVYHRNREGSHRDHAWFAAVWDEVQAGTVAAVQRRGADNILTYVAIRR